MKSQRKWLVGTIVILLFINIITIGSFWWTKRPKHPPKLETFFKKELALSVTQVTEFEKLGKKHQEEKKLIHANMKNYKDAFFKEVLSKKPNSQTVDSLTQVISDLQIQMDRQIINHFNELKSVCETAEQEEKLREIFIKSINRQKRPRKN